jgi:hypothetical protein
MPREVKLHPGDFLYCPRGTLHEAMSETEDTLHLTLGLMVRTWAEFMIEALADVALRDPVFRSSLPSTYATGTVNIGEFHATYRLLLERFALQSKPLQILGHLAESFIISRPRLAILETPAGQITLDCIVGCHVGLIYSLSSHGRYGTLLCEDVKINFPIEALAAVAFAMNTRAFAVRELPGSISDEVRLLLVKRLVEVGFVCRQNGDSSIS